jgi:uncharacterized protein
LRGRVETATERVAPIPVAWETARQHTEEALGVPARISPRTEGLGRSVRCLRPPYPGHRRHGRRLIALWPHGESQGRRRSAQEPGEEAGARSVASVRSRPAGGPGHSGRCARSSSARHVRGYRPVDNRLAATRRSASRAWRRDRDGVIHVPRARRPWGHCEMSGAPATRALTRAAATAVRAYQVAVSPFLGAHCRFQPTCSEYARQAILAHGVRRGVAMATKRISRCHPWHAGGYDPVPCQDADDGPATTHASTTRSHTS